MRGHSDKCRAIAFGGPSDARLARRDEAAWTAGFGIWRRISDAPDRPPLPAPHLKMLYRHPSLGRDS